MAELVLGVLGVVPLIGFTIKSYKELSSKVETFCHCSTAVQRLKKKLKIQRRVFENECQLLLRVCIHDDDVVEGMMSNGGHENWKQHQLNNQLKKILKQNYDECIDTIHEINEAVSQIQGELDCFTIVESYQQKNESLKKTWKRIGHSLRISFNKSNYEANLDDLKESNCNLKTIREQLKQLQKPRKEMLPRRPASTVLAWTDIRNASKTLHEALIQAWSCSQATHLRHSVKLFLEAEKVENDVELAIAILCLGHDHSTGQVDLIQLQVRSRLLALAPHPRLLLPSVNVEERRPQKRQKVVRFSAISEPIQAGGQSTSTTLVDLSSDLRCSPDVCQDFTRICAQNATGTPTHCLGHIDVSAEEHYRHQFFTSTEHPVNALGPQTMTINCVVPMDSILYRAMEDAVSALDRLKMAKALVLAVLRFHTTPWLREAWRLQDLAIFNHGEDISRSLETIHVGLDFDSKLPQIGGCSMEDVRQTPTRSSLSQLSEDDRVLCGIDNMTLHCLGVALLQIDRLRTLEAEDVLKVRKMAKTSSSLGPKYKEITEKCLRCDFGYGTDLSNAKLQAAVYGSVVGALESMIAVLDIND